MALDPKYSEAFTLVFAGDIRKFTKNPFLTDTPYGLPYAIQLGDALAELDELRGTPSSFDDDEEPS